MIERRSRRVVSAQEARLWRETMQDVVPLAGTGVDGVADEMAAVGDPPITDGSASTSPSSGFDEPPRPPAPQERATRSNSVLPAHASLEAGFTIGGARAVGREPGWTLVPARRAAGGPDGAIPTAGIDRRTDRRLRRGQLEIDGRIDLHGMTQAQAHLALAGFLHRCRHENRRCILVITGKGNHRGGPGVRPPAADSPAASLPAQWDNDPASGAGPGGGGVLRAALPRWLSEPPLRDLVVNIHPAQPRDGGDGAFYVLLKRARR